jgi:hypothetical protein
MEAVFDGSLIVSQPKYRAASHGGGYPRRGDRAVAIHHGVGGGKPRRALGCDRPLGGASLFGAGKPPLSVSSSPICTVAGTNKRLRCIVVHHDVVVYGRNNDR